MKYSVLLILILTIFLVGCSEKVALKDTTPSTNNIVSDATLDNAQTISQSELALHNLETDCWIAYQGSVYDVTAYVPIHPGGAAQIVPLCGTSNKFEDAFTTKHGTSKVSILEKQGVYKGKLE